MQITGNFEKPGFSEEVGTKAARGRTCGSFLWENMMLREQIIGKYRGKCGQA